MNELIKIITLSKPRYLEEKKKAFKNDSDITNVLSLRLEFLVMATLLRHGVEAHFMGSKQPDIEVVLDGETFHLEITRRANSDVETFHDDLEQILEETKYYGVITFDQRPVTLSSEIRNECLEKVKEFLRQEAKSNFLFRPNIPELPNFKVELFTEDVGFLSRVTIEDSALLTPILDNVEELVITKLNNKNSQAGTWNPGTVLVMDITGIARSWFRTPQMWAQNATNWIIPWSQSNFPVIVITFSDLANCELGFFCLFDPALPKPKYDAYVKLIQNLRTDNLAL
jgi:hypothetical protein